MSGADNGRANGDAPSFRQDGGRDRRMLPVALAIWAGVLVAHAWFGAVSGGGAADVTQARSLASHSRGFTLSPPVSALLALLLVASLLVVIRICRLYSAELRWLGRKLVRWPWLAVIGCAALMGGVASVGQDYAEWRDPAIVASQEGKPSVVAAVRLVSPVTAAGSWQAQCQANAVLVSFERNGVVVSSRAKTVLFINGAACSTLQDGQTIRTRGALQPARYGLRPLWLTLNDGAAITVVARAPPVKRAVFSMQRSFFAVTEQLSDQGRVLVPGLTIGLLGQDFVGRGADGPEPVNATFSKMLEMHFKDSGIMHLMAVSGGHFALIGAMMKRCCALARMPRQAVAVLTTLAYFALASAMYPSDSVVRALAMGVFASLAVIAGRRPQALSALSWTVIVTLLVEPTMARSFGFALSCAAVLGIVLCAGPLAEWLSAALPSALAEAASVTLAAQAFTLPVQVLMSPELPLLSLPANLIVAPFVDWSTLTGLAALLLSPLGLWPAYAFAWLSSLGTEVMRWCADTIGSMPSATVPWAGGLGGAALVVVAQVLSVAAIRSANAWISRRISDAPETEGRRLVLTLKSRVMTWLAETEQMFESG